MTSSNFRGAIRFALAAFISLSTAHAEGDGYLNRTGAPTVRFQAAHLQDLSILPPLPKPPAKPKEKSSANVPDASASATSSNSIPLVLSATSYPVPPNDMGMHPGIPGPMYEGTNSPHGFPAANDLLPISPQMMVEYFRPGKGSTNSAGASVFVPVDFAPPMPTPVPPSSATYRVQ